MELDCAKARRGVLRASSLLIAFSIPALIEQTQGTAYCPVQWQHGVACVSLCFFSPASAEEEDEEKARKGWIECASHFCTAFFCV